MTHGYFDEAGSCAVRAGRTPIGTITVTPTVRLKLLASI